MDNNNMNIGYRSQANYHLQQQQPNAHLAQMRSLAQQNVNNGANIFNADQPSVNMGGSLEQSNLIENSTNANVQQFNNTSFENSISLANILTSIMKNYSMNPFLAAGLAQNPMMQLASQGFLGQTQNNQNHHQQQSSSSSLHLSSMNNNQNGDYRSDQSSEDEDEPLQNNDTNLNRLLNPDGQSDTNLFDIQASNNNQTPRFSSTNGLITMTNGDSNERYTTDESMQGGEQNNNTNKRARFRSVLSDDTVRVLKTEYEINPKPTKREIIELANRVDYPPRVVQVWFQNTRARDRRLGRLPPSSMARLPSSGLTLENHYRLNGAEKRLSESMGGYLESMDPIDLSTIVSEKE